MEDIYVYYTEELELLLELDANKAVIKQKIGRHKLCLLYRRTGSPAGVTAWIGC